MGKNHTSLCFIELIYYTNKILHIILFLKVDITLKKDKKRNLKTTNYIKCNLGVILYYI